MSEAQIAEKQSFFKNFAGGLFGGKKNKQEEAPIPMEESIEDIDNVAATQKVEQVNREQQERLKKAMNAYNMLSEEQRDQVEALYQRAQQDGTPLDPAYSLLIEGRNALMMQQEQEKQRAQQQGAAIAAQAQANSAMEQMPSATMPPAMVNQQMPNQQMPNQQMAGSQVNAPMGESRNKSQASEDSAESKAIKALAVLSRLVELLAQVRCVEDKVAFSFFAVNRTREILPYDRALLFDVDRLLPKLLSISNVPIPRQESPYLTWMRAIVRHKMKDKNSANKLHTIAKDDLKETLAREWDVYVQGEMKWVPLVTPKGLFKGVLVLIRESPWREHDDTIINRICEAYAHAWVYLEGGAKRRRQLGKISRFFLLLLIGFIVACATIPVNLSVIATAKIRAKDPIVVAAPIGGVIKDIMVEPNTYVNKDTVLFSYEDSAIRNEYTISQKTIAVTRERLRTVAQDALITPESKSQVRLIQAELAQQITEREFRKKMLERVKVVAPEQGLVIFTHRNDFIGKPVSVGERIMTIADETNVEVLIELAVADDIIIHQNAKVDIFLDRNPLKGLNAVLTNANYEPVSSSSGKGLVYRLVAELDPSLAPPRIGSKGAAKIYGDEILLGLYLFRKPFTKARQFLGI